ncbi:hypothetical protein E4U55_007623 [Claviceps digitariae]|nr:hypothetical protein E4U55_007623 [Claviceps digitariae]
MNNLNTTEKKNHLKMKPLFFLAGAAALQGVQAMLRVPPSVELKKEYPVNMGGLGNVPVDTHPHGHGHGDGEVPVPIVIKREEGAGENGAVHFAVSEMAGKEKDKPYDRNHRPWHTSRPKEMPEEGGPTGPRIEGPEARLHEPLPNPDYTQPMQGPGEDDGRLFRLSVSEDDEDAEAATEMFMPGRSHKAGRPPKGVPKAPQPDPDEEDEDSEQGENPFPPMLPTVFPFPTETETTTTTPTSTSHASTTTTSTKHSHHHTHHTKTSKTTSTTTTTTTTSSSSSSSSHTHTHHTHTHHSHTSSGHPTTTTSSSSAGPVHCVKKHCSTDLAKHRRPGLEAPTPAPKVEDDKVKEDDDKDKPKEGENKPKEDNDKNKPKEGENKPKEHDDKNKPKEHDDKNKPKEGENKPKEDDDKNKEDDDKPKEDDDNKKPKESNDKKEDKLKEGDHKSNEEGHPIKRDLEPKPKKHNTHYLAARVAPCSSTPTPTPSACPITTTTSVAYPTTVISVPASSNGTCHSPTSVPTYVSVSGGVENAAAVPAMALIAVAAGGMLLF